MNKKTEFKISIFIAIALVVFLVIIFVRTSTVFGAPNNAGNIFRNLTPEADSTYYMGTTTRKWLRGWFDNLTTTKASTTQLTVSDKSWLGTIVSGIWNGTAIDISDYTNLTVDEDYFGLNGDQLIASSTLKNQFSTSWLSGGVLSINADNTKFDVTAGTGWVCDNYTDATIPTCTFVRFGPFTAQSVTDIATQDLTQIAIDVNGNIVQQETYSSEDRRDVFTIGFLVHTDKATITSVTQPADIIGFDTALSLYDFTSSLGVSVNKSGNNFTASSTNPLQLDVSAGETFALGADKSSPKNPNYFITTERSPATLVPTWRDGSGGFTFGSAVNNLDTTKYDDGTGGASEPNGDMVSNRWQVLRLVDSINTGLVFVQYGQDTYASKAEAISGINTEVFDRNNAFSTLGTRAWIIVKGGATDLTDDEQAQICLSDRLKLIPIDCSQPAGVDNLFNFANGVLITQQTASTTSNGTTVTLNIANSVGGNGTVQFAGKNYEVSMPTSTPLTAGTNAVPVQNWVYLTLSGTTPILGVSTSGFPTSGAYASLGTYEVQSAENVQAIGGLYKEHMYDNSLGNGIGTASDLPNRIRREHAVYESGVALTVNGSGTSNVTMETTSGLVWQFHLASMPAIASTTPFRVKNDSVSAFATSTNLASLDLDSLGNTLLGKYYYLTVWGIRSENASSSRLFVNLPNTSFLNLSQAQASPTSFDATIPTWARGTGFLIAKLLVNQSIGGVLTLNSTTDLRGNDPGGVSGGSGINVPLDFPDGASGFTIFNATDATKELQWNVSNITTGTTRTVTAQNSNGTMCLLQANQSFTGLNQFTKSTTTQATFTGSTWFGTLANFWKGINTSIITATSTTATSTLPQLDVTGLQISGALDLDGTATTTGASGFDITAGCYAINGTCIGAGAGSGTVTSIATTYPVLGGTITTSGTISLAFGTTTANTWSALQTFSNSTTTHATITNLYMSGDQITDFAGTGLTVTGGALNVDASQTQITAVGALDGGSITSNFGTINNGASTITTTGIISGGSFVATGSATSTMDGLYAKTGQFGSFLETPYLNATSTTATSTMNRLSITGAVSILGEYFTNFTNKIISVIESATSLNLSGVTVKTHTYPAFTYATSTAWTATTTIPLGVAYTAEQWTGVKCFTDTGTLNVSFYDGTNRMNLLNASTTVGSFVLSTNNTFTASEKRYVDVGTPASSPTKISCTVDKLINN